MATCNLFGLWLDGEIKEGLIIPLSVVGMRDITIFSASYMKMYRFKVPQP